MNSSKDNFKTKMAEFKQYIKNTTAHPSYLKQLQNFNEVELLEYVKSASFILLFMIHSKKLTNLTITTSDDFTPDTFYQFMTTQSISCIGHILTYTKNPVIHLLIAKPEQIKNIFQQVTSTLENILQYHRLNDTLNIGHCTQTVSKI